MTISSIGYYGTISDVQWPLATPFVGHANCVKSQTDFAPSIVTGVDRTVRFTSGQVYGYGVLDTSTASIDVQLDVLGSGTRWDALVVHRSWTPGIGGTTTVTKVNGTSVKAVPAGLASTPGTSTGADQLLALVQITAGQTQPTALIDCRFAPDGGMYTRAGADLLGVPMGSTAWANLTLAGGLGTTGLLLGTQSPAVRVKNGTVRLRGAVSLSNGNGFPVGATLLATLSPTYAPDRTVERSVACEQRSVYNSVRLEFKQDGSVLAFVPATVTDLPHWISLETEFSPTTTY